MSLFEKPSEKLKKKYALYYANDLVDRPYKWIYHIRRIELSLDEQMEADQREAEEISAYPDQNVARVQKNEEDASYSCGPYSSCGFHQSNILAANSNNVDVARPKVLPAQPLSKPRPLPIPTTDKRPVFIPPRVTEESSLNAMISELRPDPFLPPRVFKKSGAMPLTTTNVMLCEDPSLPPRVVKKSGAVSLNAKVSEPREDPSLPPRVVKKSVTVGHKSRDMSPPSYHELLPLPDMPKVILRRKPRLLSPTDIRPIFPPSVTEEERTAFKRMMLRLY